MNTQRLLDRLVKGLLLRSVERMASENSIACWHVH